MSEKIETQGKTVEAAVNEALLRLGARRDEVDVTVLDEPKGGFLGLLGGRPAKVEVSRKRGRRSGQRKESSDQAYGFGDNSKSGRSRRGGRNNRRGPRPEKTAQNGNAPQAAKVQKDVAKPAEANQRGGGERKPRNDNDRRSRNRRPRQQDNRQQENRNGNTQEQPTARSQEGSSADANKREDRRPRNARQDREPRQDRRPRNARPVKGERAARPERNEQAETQDRPNGRPERQERSDRQERPNRQGRPESSNNSEPPQPRAARAPNTPPDEIIATGISVGKYAKAIREIAPEEVNQTLENMTTGLLVRAGFPARCEIVDGEYQQVKVITGDDSAGMLIGRHGATIDSVEHLVERMISMAAGDRVRMNLDINNYRLRRHESLLERVEDAVAKVRESGKTYHVEPMNARERRIVHLAVEEFEGLRTFTMDGHSGRHVVIALENNPQEEKAKPEAQNEAQNEAPVEAPAETPVEAPLEEAVVSEEASAAEPIVEDQDNAGPREESIPEANEDDQPRA